eukprot:TRINITY_DN20580_c0_g1_i12.p1 TRINITY_DN20580_c0_g1~~TRINITY_DN20580_c0_g1_i12.p1  ORF type:complete len:805 (+),score=233.64 TRINITY_DN20580_c0_g1_i12:1641-4055(+)
MAGTVEREYSKIMGEIDIAAFEDKVDEERFLEVMQRETLISETRLRAEWEQLKWEGSTHFMEKKTKMLNEANAVLCNLLEENQHLRELVDKEDTGEELAEVNISVQAENLETVYDMIGEDRTGDKFREERQKLESRRLKEQLVEHNKQNRKRETLREVLHYIAFIFVISVVFFGQRESSTGADYFLPESVRNALAETKGTPQGVDLTQVQDMGSLWRWIEDSPFLYKDPAWYNGNQVIKSEEDFVNLQTKIVGRIRYRTMRLKPEDCQLSETEGYIAACFPAWSNSEASEARYGYEPAKAIRPTTDPNDGMDVTNGDAVKSYDGDAEFGSYAEWLQQFEDDRIAQGLSEDNRTRYNWTYTSASENDSPAPMLGRFGDYDGGGFVVDMPLTLSDQLRQVRGMKEHGYLDNNTAALLINVNLYNGNTDKYGVVSILFETPYTGNVVPTINVQVARLFTYQTAGDFLRFLMELCVIAYLVYFCYAESEHLVGGRWRDHLKTGWFWLDFVNLLLFLVEIPLQIYIIFWLKGSDLRDPTDPTKYYELTYVFYLWQIMLQLNALNLNILYFKLFKYIGIFKAVGRVIQVFTKAAEDLLVFNVVLLAVLLGFAQAGFVAFGSFSPEFSSYPSSIGTMLRTLTQAFEYHEIQARAPFFAPLFFFGWTFLVIFLMLKNVPAILMFAYQSTNMSDLAVERMLLDPTLSKEMTKALKFTYDMKHGGQDEVEQFIKNLIMFENSPTTIMMAEEHLERMCTKCPNALFLASIGSIGEVFEIYDTDKDLKLDKRDVREFRLDLERVVKRFHRLSMLLD